MVGRCLRGALLVTAIVGPIVLSGCKDDLPPPTSGTLLIELAEGSVGAADGARIYLDDEVWIDSVAGDDYSRVLPAGTYALRIEKECTTVSPTPERTIEIEPTGLHRVVWQVDVNGGLVVESSVVGAPIFLDGNDTGRVTPTTFECLEAGSRVVSVGEVVGFATPDPQTVEVSESVVSVSFEFGDPLTQTRGALVELLTAVDCAFCLPADEAAERLWDDPAHEAAGIVSVQVHHPWFIPDVFRTVETEARNTFYGFPPNNGSHPITRTNGMSQTIGFPQGQTEETFYEGILERVEPFITGEMNESIVALYWLASHFDEESHTATARMRVVALGDIPNPPLTGVLGMVYKNNLTTFARVHQRDVEFYRVVRDIVEIGTCDELGISQRGDWADVEFTFDLSDDTEWSEEEMGLVGLVQETGEGGSKEIFNTRHVFLE